MSITNSGKVRSAERMAARAVANVGGSCEAPISSADGILAGVARFESFCATTSGREEWPALAATIAPLSATIAMAKNTIRRRQSLVVTPAMQDSMRELLVWHAMRCSAALLGRVYEPNKKKIKTAAEMQRLQGNLVRKLQVQPGTRLPRPPSSSSSSEGGSAVSTASPSAPSATSSSTPRSSAKASKLTSFPKSTRGVVFFLRVARVSPGAAFVPANRPTVRADPRAGHLLGSGAVRR